MIVTDRFVYLHEPKTGGTSVTSALLRLHGIRWSRLHALRSTVQVEMRFRTPYGTLVFHNNKHGIRSQIPARYADRPVLASVRNPLDLLVSQYEFGWWRRPEMRRVFADAPGFPVDYPTFPDLTFPEFVRLAEAAFQRIDTPRFAPDDRPGWLTRQFFRYYFPDPADALARLAPADLDGDTPPPGPPDTHFLHTHRLNDDLHAFLRQAGYPDAAIAFILPMDRVLPQGKGRDGRRSWEGYYDDALRATVRHRERYLFQRFPDFLAVTRGPGQG